MQQTLVVSELGSFISHVYDFVKFIISLLLTADFLLHFLLHFYYFFRKNTTLRTGPCFCWFFLIVYWYDASVKLVRPVFPIHWLLRSKIKSETLSTCIWE